MASSQLRIFATISIILYTNDKKTNLKILKRVKAKKLPFFLSCDRQRILFFSHTLVSKGQRRLYRVRINNGNFFFAAIFTQALVFVQQSIRKPKNGLTCYKRIFTLVIRPIIINHIWNVALGGTHPARDSSESIIKFRKPDYTHRTRKGYLLTR